MENMKTGIVLILALVNIASAQTNTNNAPIFISFTNTVGEYITNAEVVTVAPNKLVYRADDGLSGGTIRLEKLPPDLQAKFHFDPDQANVADQMENDRKTADLQKRIAGQQAAEEQAKWDAALKLALSKRQTFYGDIMQKIDAGLLVRSPGSYGASAGESSVTILLKDYPLAGSVAADDQIHVSAFPVGLYSYTTVKNSVNTIHAWTCDTNVAVRYYLLLND